MKNQFHSASLIVTSVIILGCFLVGRVAVAAPASSSTLNQPFSRGATLALPQILDPSKTKALDALFVESMTSSKTQKLSALKLTVDEFIELSSTGQVTHVNADIPNSKSLPNWLKNITSTNPDCNPLNHLPDPKGKGTWTTILPNLQNPSVAYRVQMCVDLCEKKARLRDSRMEGSKCDRNTSEKDIIERIDFWKQFLDLEYQYWKVCFNHEGLEHLVEQPPRKDDHVQKFYDSIQALMNCLEQKSKYLKNAIYASPWYWELKQLYPGFQSGDGPPLWETEPQPSVRPVQVQNPPAGFPGDWTLWCVPVKPGPPSTSPAAGIGNTSVGGLKCLLRKAGGLGSIFIGLPFLPGYKPPSDDPWNPPGWH